ncbi:ComEC/Rec2 family competence protein [Chloroflexota bacterium]
MNRFKATFVSLFLVILLLISCSPYPSPTTPSPTPPTDTPVSILSVTPTPTPASPSSAITSTNGTLTIHFIDVGQGDSILIDFGQTEILIDGGNRSPEVANYINPYIDGALEAMVATHPHADHIGGLIDVLVKYDVNDIWLNGDTATSKTYTDFINLVNAENATVHQSERGNTIQMGTLAFNILNPSKPLFSDANNNSIVLSLSYGDVDFLFMGDAERKAESTMLNLISDIEVLKVGHHGSRSSSSPEFLTLAKPKVAVYSAGLGNSYGHPHQETIDALTNIGAKIYGTDTSGTIKVVTEGKTYTMQTTK